MNWWLFLTPDDSLTPKDNHNRHTTLDNLLDIRQDKIVTLFVTPPTKNPPQITLRGIFVEHRRIELLTF